MATPHLVTIPFSHFCDKARWGLDRAGIRFRESGHVPIVHIPAVRLAGGKRSVPTLITDEGAICDSTKILQWADARSPEAHLYGASSDERREIEQLEDLFDDQLGPHARRWVYFYILAQPELLRRLAAQGVPTAERLAWPFMMPVARVLMRRSMRITAEGAKRSRERIEHVFAEVGARLADGRRYLVGERLSAADISFASLAGPVLLPPEYFTRLPSIDAWPSEAAEQIRAWQASPAGAFGLRIYRDHRRA
ncbi:glutathione S-transferase family protein [Polyangium aurulentum]|uniref:glutathione S-transferase family protein n=1 Tax=Polyangium aurulentum TaxID=2567896 RepID=UPI0010AE2F0E|nr:glutathione S-transferase family protein [Polyangium aurulentum]UQA55990.1 glutathione S-transferase family protein [Polyangium aurulentum]